MASITGETLTEGPYERLERERLRRGQAAGLADRLLRIGRHCAGLPDLDRRSPDDIVGYDA